MMLTRLITVAVAALALALGAPAASAAVTVPGVKYKCFTSKGSEVCNKYVNGKRTHRCTVSKRTGKRLCSKVTGGQSGTSCALEGTLTAASSTPRGKAVTQGILSLKRVRQMKDGQTVLENGKPVWVLSASVVKPGYALCRAWYAYQVSLSSGFRKVDMPSNGKHAAVRLAIDDVPFVAATVRRVG